MPLLSFIIPVYNLPISLVLECLDSIFALSLEEDEREVIVVDDGSENSFHDELGDYQEEVTYIRTSNQGLGPARNLGMSKASGRFVQFVDGDDTLIPEIYDQCLDFVRDDEVDIVMFGMETHRRTNAAKCVFGAKICGADYMLKNNLRGAAWGYIFRREIVGDLRFSKIICEDEEFTPQLLLRADRVVNTDTPAYFYRQRNGSIINNNNNQKQEKRMSDVLGVIVRLRDLALTLDGCNREALSRRVAQLTMDYIYNRWRLSGSLSVVSETLRNLETLRLYPLPTNNYTLKYTLSRHFLKLL